MVEEEEEEEKEENVRSGGREGEENRIGRRSGMCTKKDEKKR